MEALLPSVVRTPDDSNGPPLFYFEISIFGGITVKIFFFTNYERGARGEKSQTFGQIFQKRIKTAFLACFFKTCVRRNQFGQTEVVIRIWGTSENQFDQPKKIDKVFEIILKIQTPHPPTIEYIYISAPISVSTTCRPKGSSLYYFEISSFGWLTLKLFLRRLWRQNLLILKGEGAPNKRDFLVKLF